MGSLLALLHCLSTTRPGVVPTSSMAELHRCVVDCSGGAEQHCYSTVLQRIIQEYYCTLVAGAHEKKNHDDDTEEALYFLIVGCYNSQCRYFQLLHKEAHRQYQYLRSSSTTSSPSSSSFPRHGTNAVERALQHQIALAEQCCTCQRDFILWTRKYKKQSPTTTSNDSRQSLLV